MSLGTQKINLRGPRLPAKALGDRSIFCFQPRLRGDFVKRKSISTSKQIGMARVISMRRSQLRKKATAAEIAVKGALDRLGLRYTFQRGCMCGGTGVRILDFYIHKPYRIAIEIDGSSHDGMESSDLAREKQILSAYKKMRFFRITNAEVFDLGSGIDAHIIAGLENIRKNRSMCADGGRLAGPKTLCI